MSEELVIPKEMLEAAERAVWECRFGCQGYDAFRGRADILAALTAAMYWLKDNPSSPTTEQARIMIRERVDEGYLSENDYNSISFATVKAVCEEWQRRQFMVPTPERKTVLHPSMPEWTYSDDEARVLIEMIERIQKIAQKQLRKEP
jgi:hypothetical protein